MVAIVNCRFGHYSDEMFRACRLVVDTGIHSLGWTREKAVDFMYTHTAMTRVAVEVRKDTYSYHLKKYSGDNN